MSKNDDSARAARRARHAQIRAEVAAEEAEAGAAEAAEAAAALDIPLHVRISRDLNDELRERAAAEQIPMSALVRRLLGSTVPSVQARPVGELVTRVTSDTVLLREAASSATPVPVTR